MYLWLSLLTLVLMLSPGLIGFTASVLGFAEHDSILGMLPWAMFYTVPIGAVVLMLLGVVAAVRRER